MGWAGPIGSAAVTQAPAEGTIPAVTDDEQDYSEQELVRREKLDRLKAAGSIAITSRPRARSGRVSLPVPAPTSRARRSGRSRSGSSANPTASGG